MKRLFEKKWSCVLAGALAGALVMSAALLIAMGGASGLRTALKLGAILRIFDTQFVADYDDDLVRDSVMAGAVSGLDDRWSYYMTAEEYDAYQDYAANRYQGIGVTIQKDEDSGGFLVTAVTKDGPAMLAGILPGDILLGVDGVSVVGGEGEDLRALIQADFGGEALVMLRHEDGSEEEIPVSCEEIFSSPVTNELLEDGTGYVAILNFRDGAANEAVAAIEELLDQGAERLVFDVRNDPGGQLTELVALLDNLLPEGDLFIRADRQGREGVEVSDATCLDMPMAVVVNGDSYSAAEFFAAALQEYDWAVVVGEPTTGKARSQITVAQADGSAVHLSKYSYLTPNGTDLYEAGGIVPDVEIALDEEERQLFDSGWMTPGEDPQIQAAIEALTS